MSLGRIDLCPEFTSGCWDDTQWPSGIFLLGLVITS
jgi:hypothetical protein